MLHPPTRLSLAFVALVLATCTHTIAGAQCPAPPATSNLAEGEIGVFFDPLGTVTCGNPVVGASTPLYIVVRVPPGGMDAFPIPNLVAANDIAAGMLIGPAFLPEDSPFLWNLVADDCNLGTRPDGQATCPAAQGDLVVIAQLLVSLPVAMTGTACFETVCSSFIGDVSMTPSYTSCDGTNGAFTGSETLCIELGTAPVPVETTTWGAVKATYR